MKETAKDGSTMRLGWSKSKNATSYYVYKSVYKNKKRTTEVVEKLGTDKQICEKYLVSDAKAWAKQYIETLNKKADIDQQAILLSYIPSKPIPLGVQQSYNCGYLFLQHLYHRLGLHKICRAIAKKYDFEFDLNSVMSRLLYSRILFPCSKLATNEVAKSFIEPPTFDLHHIYRSLSYIAKESDYIQSRLYKNSLEKTVRNTNVIYYDCTNYFFEIEEADADGDRQFGISKENKPNPLVQMGLFMDGDGIPLSFSITPGNTNEQTTLKPLEQKLLTDFELSQFVVCTDAGLASHSNRVFNTKQGRSFITTQSVKKLKNFLKDWALSPTGWSLPGSLKTFDISKVDNPSDKDTIFYKERWISENGLEQKLIVTYSSKYKNYQQNIRNGQVERATKAIDKNPGQLTKKRATDYRRFAKMSAYTDEGEIADNTAYDINSERIAEESRYDGFYAVCTNIDDDACEIIKINQRRWEIEECFRIMKTDFKSRPIYLQTSERIQAHFMTCFLSLILYRYLEKELDDKYTTTELLGALRNMNVLEVKGRGYIPTYTRSKLTDALHEAFGFRTDYQIIPPSNMRNICSQSKKQ